MEGKPQYRYNRVRPTRSVTSDANFNGEIQFEWAATSDVMVDLAHAYLDLNATLVKGGGNWILGATDNASDNNQGICQNPMGALFKSGVLYINDKEVNKKTNE